MPVHAAPRLLLQLGLLLASSAASACLPVLSNDELQARIASAPPSDSSSQGDGAGASGLCGNGVVDKGEQCDDNNTNACDACENCSIRRVLDAKDAKALALADSPKLNLVKGVSYSYSVWFKLRKFPDDEKSALFVALLSDKFDEALMSMGIAKPKNVNTALPFCKFPSTKLTEKSAYLVSKTPVQVGTWHHLRCFHVGGKASLSLDGAAPDQVPLDLGILSVKQGSKLLVGRMDIPELDAFDGWLDELHVQTGVSDAIWQQVHRRVPSKDAGVALFHMDSPPDAKVLTDSAPNPADAKQVRLDVGKSPSFLKEELPMAAEACYDYSADAAACSGAGKVPPWCKP